MVGSRPACPLKTEVRTGGERAGGRGGRRFGLAQHPGPVRLMAAVCMRANKTTRPGFLTARSRYSIRNWALGTEESWLRCGPCSLVVRVRAFACVVRLRECSPN